MIAKICLFALICGLLAALLQSLGYKSKGLFTVLSALLIFSAVSGGLADIFGGIASFTEGAGIGEAVKAALKVIGLGYIFGFTSDVLLSLGEGLIASAVTVAGRVQMMLAVYPFIDRVVKLGVELLS